MPFKKGNTLRKEGRSGRGAGTDNALSAEAKHYGSPIPKTCAYSLVCFQTKGLSNKTLTARLRVIVCNWGHCTDFG